MNNDKLQYNGFYFRKTTQEDIAFVANNMRKNDRIEVKRWGGFEVDYELKKSVEYSDVAWTGVFDSGEIACIFGASYSDILESKGRIWMLSTAAINAHPITFVKASRVGLNLVKESLPQVKIFENYVDSEYTSAVKWIKKLGGQVFKAKTCRGKCGGDFFYFRFLNNHYKEEV